MRARAEEVLVRSEVFKDAHARAVMLRIAASYTKLADRLEKEADQLPE